MTDRCKNITLATTALQLVTRLHSSRMHTTHLLPVSPSMHCAGRSGPGGDGVSGPGGCVWSQGGPASGPGEGVVYPSMQWGRPPCGQNS